MIHKEYDLTMSNPPERVGYSHTVSGYSHTVSIELHEIIQRRCRCNKPFYRKMSNDFRIGRQNTRFNRNTRPKGTHTNFKLYR